MAKSKQGLDIATFLGSSIHDMKNSVSIMQALLEDALTEVHLHDNCPAGRQLDRVLYETQRISDNLVQLLALYKIDRELYPFDPQEHDVGDFMLEAEARVGSLAQFRGIAFTCDYPSGLVWFFDRELVLCALVQALHNGLRYTRSRLHFSVITRDGILEFKVEDDGPGYPVSMLEYDSRHPPAQGIHFATGSTGLGLHFSSVVARLHRNRSRIGATRLENGGTLGGGVYILTLP